MKKYLIAALAVLTVGCIRAIEMFRPKIVYPYHYGETDLTPVVEHFKDNKSIEVRIRQMQ